MTFFESELYRDPYQDLNRLWWECVERYQKIQKPSGREHKQDWAAKYHIGLAPVYYFGYLMGEMLASALEESILESTGSRNLDTKGAGEFLQQKLFYPGNRLRWDHLLEQVLGKPLTADPWINQFAVGQVTK
jgi:peptidyl-dipeptidase A